MVLQLDISSTTPTGLLSETWLHPTALLGNPYSAACANCTHRQEYWWQLRVYITSASFTGARVGVLALPDPSYSGGLTPATVWGAVANGRGSMIDSSGNRSREAKFQIQGSTTMLSNAHPPANMNMLGYADAILITWLLQSPIALGQDSKINVTIMARCCLQGRNPVPGYLLAQLPHPSDQPQTRPNPGQKPSWILDKGEGVGPVPGDRMGSWAVSHVGDAWLAGGWYFNFAGAHAPAPSGTQNDQPRIKGMPCWGCVYTSSDIYPEWETNRGHHAVPKYFACYLSPISRYVFLVGFTNFDWAQAQASGHTGLVPPDVELCIKYSGPEPTWSKFAGDTDKVQTYFYEIWRADPGRVGQVYTTVNEIQDGDYPQDTYSLATAPFRVPTLAQPWPYLSPRTASTTNSLSETTSRPLTQQPLLQPRYSAARAGSMTSTSSSSSWSSSPGPDSRVPPTAPQMTIEELTAQLTRLAACVGGQFLPPELPPVNPPADPQEDAQSQDSYSTPSDEQELQRDPDLAQQSEAQPAGAQYTPESPLPQTPAGLPDWTTLWMRALQYAGQGPAPGLPYVP